MVGRLYCSFLDKGSMPFCLGTYYLYLNGSKLSQILHYGSWCSAQRTQHGLFWTEVAHKGVGVGTHRISISRLPPFGNHVGLPICVFRNLGGRSRSLHSFGASLEVECGSSREDFSTAAQDV